MMRQFQVWNKGGLKHPPYLVVQNCDKYDYLWGFWRYIKDI